MKIHFRQWKATPVTTTINTVTQDISKVDFPAISICKPGTALSTNLFK